MKKNKKIQRVSLIFLSFFVLLGGWYLFNTLAYHRWFNTHPMGAIVSPSKLKELEEITNQSFHFCGLGSTSKAYGSEDGRYVIKVFIPKHYVSRKCKYIPFLSGLANKRKVLRVKYKRSLGPMYAYQYLPRETGLIYYQFIHPRGLFHKTVNLIEKDGAVSQLDLDKEEFLIQRKAIIVDEYLRALLKKQDLAAVKSAISKLVHFTTTLYNQGIQLTVLQFLDNFGFLDDEPIRIDLEHLRFDPKWKTKGKGHLKKQLLYFRAWIVENAPLEVLDYFDAECKELL